MRRDLRQLADREIAEHSARFFKCGVGEYGEGDRFLGIRVPALRKQVRLYRDAPETAILSMFRSSYHEERLFAVLLLVEQYARGDAASKERIYAIYLENRAYVNNWDLVDSSAYKIVGPHLQERSRRVLYKLAAAPSVWDRRIAVIATYHFIRQNNFNETLKLAAILRDDEHDLIHKAVGWMLREVGNRDLPVEEAFLEANYQYMPRTMLRYAIEKMPTARRKAYLNGTV